jgi:serine/threonine protein kinase
VQTLRDCFIKVNEVTGERQRVPACFSLLSLHHRTLKDTVRVQHPEQRPLPFRYVIAVVSGIADALAAAAGVGVVHLDMKEDNVMVDDPEAMDFEAEQRAAAPAGTADAMVVDYSKLIRRFERQPVAVVIDWGVAMLFEGGLVRTAMVRSVAGTSELALPDGFQPWGNGTHASPELHIEWKRASDELERAKVAVVQAYQAKTVAEQGARSVFCCLCEMCRSCLLTLLLLCRRRRG